MQPKGAAGGAPLPSPGKSGGFAQNSFIKLWGVEVCLALFSSLSPILRIRALNQHHMTAGSFSHDSSSVDGIISQRHVAALLLRHRRRPGSRGSCVGASRSPSQRGKIPNLFPVGGSGSQGAGGAQSVRLLQEQQLLIEGSARPLDVAPRWDTRAGCGTQQPPSGGQP